MDMNWYPTMILAIGLIDGGMILVLGAAAAVAFLLKWDADALYQRIMPACGVLVGTSIAAGVVVAITRWIVHYVAA